MYIIVILSWMVMAHKILKNIDYITSNPIKGWIKYCSFLLNNLFPCQSLTVQRPEFFFPTWHNCISTAGFMKTVPSVYSLLLNTIYLSHSTGSLGNLFQETYGIYYVLKRKSIYVFSLFL